MNITLPAVIASILVLMIPCLSHAAEEAASAYQWLPAQAAGEELKADEKQGEVSPVVLTKTPKGTADASKFTKEYLIDLEKSQIRNDGTHPVETARGINEALQQAKKEGANRIVFPKGTYLISEEHPLILNHQNTIIDLNGATLQMNTNGLPKYHMVNIVDGAENIRLTNGTLRGDRDTHDYKTIKAPHEGCSLMSFTGGHEIEVDHMVFADAPGFCVTSSATGPGTREELIKMLFHWIRIDELESGAFSGTGEKIADPTKIRTAKAYDVTNCGGTFEFGWTEGYQGFPFIKDRNYQTVFYDADRKFLEKQKNLQFKKVAIPARAKFVGLEFNQPEVSAEPGRSGATKAGHCGRISNFRPPTDVHFHDNQITNNRALGMAYCGGQRWLIENNTFQGNGGQAPSYAVDLEDGWELMQSVVFRNNTFKDNANDLVVCAGSELLFEGNHFEKTVVVYGRAYNYTFKDNRFVGSPVNFSTRSGVLSLNGNHYENCNVLHLQFDGKGVADGFLRLPGTTVKTPPITMRNETLVNVEKVTGTYFDFVDSHLKNVRFLAGRDTVLASFKNCDITGSSLTCEAGGPPVSFLTENNRGTLEKKGPGIDRTRPLARP